MKMKNLFLLPALIAVMVLAQTTMATTITVSSTADSGAGTLRAALASAASGDTIDASGVTGTILLTSGELLVTNSVTILGPGPANLAVNGNAASRVFHISGAAVTIAGLTIANGWADSGGGIYTGPGALTVSNCTLNGNSATNDSGGGIYSAGTVQIANSTLNGIAVFGRRGAGGGIYNEVNATLTVSASTLSGNWASAYGGGIFNDGRSSGTAAVQIANSTLSGNSAQDGGGAIYNAASSGKATLTVKASTFSGNSVGGGNGGAIWNYGGASAEIGSTILNAGGSGGPIANLSGTVTSDGYNLASDDGGGFLTGTADQINTNPMLGPLQDNGGPTFTHALLPGSPAIDKGKNFSGSATDQCGFPRTVDRPCIAKPLGGDGTDIGAFEVQQPCPLALSLSNVGVVLNQFGFDIVGGSNEVVVVEASTNLVNWTALATNTLGASPLHFNDPDWTNIQQRFYRARLAP